MPEVTINFWAVLVAAAASMVIGSVWYSPALFGKTWMKLAGITASDEKKGRNRGMALMVVSSLVTAYVLAYIVDYATADTFYEGVVVGFLVWLGFVATTFLMAVAFEGKSWQLYFINNGNQLLTLVTMAVILTLWT